MAVEKTGERKRLLVVGLHVLVLEVLPLAALVDGVPDAVGGVVEGDLHAESADKDDAEEDVVLAEDGVVNTLESGRGHCEEWTSETGRVRW